MCKHLCYAYVLRVALMHICVHIYYLTLAMLNIGFVYVSVFMHQNQFKGRTFAFCDYSKHTRFFLPKPFAHIDHIWLTDWRSCTKQMGCSKICVVAYMKRYGNRCARIAGRSQATCQDYARVHNGGPGGCYWSKTLDYWSKIRACCDRVGGC